MKETSWYRIAAKHGGDDDGDGGHAEILIYGDIGKDWFGEGIAAEDLVKELATLDVATLDVRINSVGGQVFEGLAIFNALDRHPAKVTTHIDGMAASIASIVALAGETVWIAENAFMMIHNAHGFQIGDANAMRKMADILEKLDGSLAETYVAKTGKSSKVIRAMMDEETWFNAEEALEAGMVDEVVEAMDVAASFDLSKFRNVRPDVLERAAVQIRPAAKSHVMPLDVEGSIADDSDRNDPDLIQLAAESEATLARTLL
ncbi:MAG: Clp protease ClpP [Actinomycetota bacterium]|nr:Clp protease ClpP [Actinomycetota bacterium]